MSFSQDNSADYNLDGVVDATLISVDGLSAQPFVKVRRGSLSIGDLQAGFASPGDVVFVVWVGTIGSVTLDEGATLRIDSIDYRILSRPMQRADAAQARVFTRQEEA